MGNPLLLIDSERSYIEAIGEYLSRILFDVYMATDSAEALRMVNLHMPHYIVGDPNITDTDAVDFFQDLKSQSPDTAIIIITEEDRIDSIMEKMRLDAFSYLRKPVNPVELELTLLRAKEWRNQQNNLDMFTDRLAHLHRATMLYQQLFDEIPCYLTVQNKDYHITATNKLFKQNFGNAIGEYCYKVYKHRDTPCPNCPVFETFEDGKFHSTEEVVTSKNGQPHHVITWTAPVRGDDGDITQVIEMSTDITQIRELQNHLESLGMMLGSMSHGVKGMLTALDGGIYQIETGLKKKNEARVQKALGVVKDMSQRITKMVLDILYYAKSRELNKEETNIRTFSRNLSEPIQAMVSKKHIRFETHIRKNLGTFHIDPHWFHSAISNILENSLDACLAFPEEEDRDLVVTLTVSADHEHVFFNIKDNGLGMTKEVKDKIFTLFFSSKGSKGTGLGLFISNHVVKEHGGTINVTSFPETGSEFTVKIPRKHDGSGGDKGLYIFEKI